MDHSLIPLSLYLWLLGEKTQALLKSRHVWIQLRSSLWSVNFYTLPLHLYVYLFYISVHESIFSCYTPVFVFSLAWQQ